MKHRVLSLALAAAFGAVSMANAATTITIAAFPNLDDVIKGALEGFKKENPDIEVKIQSLAYGDHHNALTTALAAGGTVADAVAFDMGYVAKFVEGGALEDLSKAPYSIGQYNKGWAAYTVPLTINSKKEQVAAPTDLGPGTMYYRQDVLDKAGVKVGDLTKSWASYINAGKTIKAKTGAYMLGNATNVLGIVIRSGLKNGDGLYFNKAGKTVVNTPRFVKAFTLAKQIRDNKLDAKIGEWSSEWYEAFKSGTMVTQFSGAWLEGHLRNWIAPNTKGLWRASNLPEGINASWGGSFYAIPKNAKNKEAAWKLIQYLTANKSQQENAMRSINAFPSLLAAQTDELFNEPLPFLGGQKARLLWRDVAKKIPALITSKYDPIAEAEVSNALTKVLEEGKDIKAALAEAQATIDRRANR